MNETALDILWRGLHGSDTICEHPNCEQGCVIKLPVARELQRQGWVSLLGKDVFGNIEYEIIPSAKLKAVKDKFV